MIRNYLKVAIRSLLKQKVYTFINVTGLSVGIASFILIALQVVDELSYDRFFENSENIYKVVLERKYPDHVTNYAIIPHSFSQVMVRDFPEVKNAVRLFGGGNNVVQVKYVNELNEEKVFEERRFMAADTTFFDIFSLQLLKGDQKSALSKPQSVVINESTAQKYFGDEEPIDKTLSTDFGELKVTGVCEDVPENSHMEFDFLSSMTSLQFIINNENFTGFSVHLYLELHPGASPEQLQSKFPRMIETYAAPQIEANLKTTFKEYTAAGNGYNYSLIPLPGIHLFPVEYQAQLKQGGDINDVYILISIAILIVVIASINFMNLATARSTERAKEVGIRKTLGSQQNYLVGQFLTESIVLCFIATIVATVLIQLALPSYNSLIGKSLTFVLSDPIILGSLALIIVLVGIASGFYPAFVLSSFNPVAVMKGHQSSGRGATWLRNELVVFQFFISIILIIGTLTVQDQLKYINSKDMGYDRCNLVTINRVNVLNRQQQTTFMEELRKQPNVEAVGSSSFSPINRYIGIFFQLPGEPDVFTANMMSSDDEYLSTMGFEIVKGRGFSEEFNDSLSAVINEQMAAFLELDEPIGHKLINSNGNPPILREVTIIGVVKDFHYMSLKERISPFVLLSSEGGINPIVGTISVRIDEDNKQATLSTIEGVWKKFASQEPFKYQFLDDDLQVLYQSESNTGKIFGVFSLLAIIIACVGLFGLAAYISGLRTKEIGIRKVLGASVGSVVYLLSKDFTKLIVIAFILAIPAGWYVMNSWLDVFAYRIDMGMDTFLFAGLVAIAIAWITVSYQSIKAAVIDPVKSLRSE